LSFQNLNLIEPLLRALDDEGYSTPTPIQEQAIPVILERKDLLGCAQTGTGKTAAFALPLLQLLCEDSAGVNENTRHGGSRPIKALILTPTRELAIQIDESFAAYGRHTGIRHTVIFGGVPQNSQVQALQRGVDVLVATPGRLLDLCEQKLLRLDGIKYFVLDEADRMLDMGFINDVRRILTRLPQKKHSLFFSATMPPEIQKLAASILVNPSKVEVTPVSSTAETIQQSIYFVEKKDKRSLLLHILKSSAIPTALVFTRTKHGADKVAQGLTRAGIRAEAIHGNKSQNARQRALVNFKNRHTRILVATDIAARGIDIDDLTHVINFELPNVPETYVHRIGRTGRAGASGTALSFCDGEEREFLRDIQKLIARQIPVVEDHPHVMHASLATHAPVSEDVVARAEANRNNGRSGNGGNNGGNRNRDRQRRNGPPQNSQQQGRPPRREPQQGRDRRAGEASSNRRPEPQSIPGQPVGEAPGLLLLESQPDELQSRQPEQKRESQQRDRQPEQKRESQRDQQTEQRKDRRPEPRRDRQPEPGKEATGGTGPDRGRNSREASGVRKPRPNPEQLAAPEAKKTFEETNFSVKVNQSAGDEKW
jgi:ATP-dependent RNA helicase RhlE